MIEIADFFFAGHQKVILITIAIRLEASSRTMQCWTFHYLLAFIDKSMFTRKEEFLAKVLTQNLLEN